MIIPALKLFVQPILRFIDLGLSDPEQIPETETEAPATQLTPRESQVFQVLDSAELQGSERYEDLIAIVEDLTGQGCARRIISKWRKARGFSGVRLA